MNKGCKNCKYYTGNDTCNNAILALIEYGEDNYLNWYTGKGNNTECKEANKNCKCKYFKQEHQLLFILWTAIALISVMTMVSIILTYDESCGHLWNIEKGTVCKGI